MTPLDILERLAAEGLTATLKLRLDGDSEPSPELDALIAQHKDDLITYLARRGGAPPAAHTVRVDLPANILCNLLIWIQHYHELRVKLPDKTILNASPESVLEAAEQKPWGIVYCPDRTVLMAWGAPPTFELHGLTHLEVGEPLHETAVN